MKEHVKVRLRKYRERQKTGLKVCPFCGENASVLQIPENTAEEIAKHPNWKWNNPGMWVVGCDTDNCIGCMHNFSMIFVTKEQAVDAWNRRYVNGKHHS